MIQFNLLPNVKLEYVRARRNKRLTLLVAVLIAGAALAIMVILFLGQLVQKKHSNDLSKDITAESSKLENTPDLNKILTIQNQLDSLPALHDEKPVATRLLNFVKQVTPASATIAKLEVDFSTQTVKVTGTADKISTINVFVDTLKFTTYNTEDNRTGNAYSKVVLNSFGKEATDVKYEISFNYDPLIFSNETNVALNVPPGKVTTRSETEKPLFQPLPTTEGAQ